MKDLIVGVTLARMRARAGDVRSLKFSGCLASSGWVRHFCCFGENVSFTSSKVIDTATKPVELMKGPGKAKKKPSVFQD